MDTNKTLSRVGVRTFSTSSDVQELIKRFMRAAISHGLKPKVIDDNDPLTDIDVVVSFGGDGTLLSAHHLVMRSGRFDVPVCGVNVGHVGFITDFGPDDVELLAHALKEGEYVLHHRRPLVVVRKEATGQVGEPMYAINDVSINRVKGNAGRLITTELFVNGEHLSTFNADGVIVASPTGSTAYNLSAGGPVIMSCTKAMSITPICPQTLTTRPLVIPSHYTVGLAVQPRRGRNEEKVQLWVDGEDVGDLAQGQWVEVSTDESRPLYYVTYNRDNLITRLKQRLSRLS